MELITWENKENFCYEYGYILYRIVMYYHFFLMFFSLSLTKVIYARYILILNAAEDILEENKLKILISPLTDETSFKFIKMKRILWLLDNVIQNFNCIFGWAIFFGTLTSLIVCLGDLNYILAYANTKDASFNTSVSIINAVYAFIYSVCRV